MVERKQIGMATVTYERRKVYDGVLRLIHAWNGLALLCLMATVWLSGWADYGAGQKTLWQLHVILGYGLVLGLAARFAWGLVGPAKARFGDLWHPRQWLAAIRARSLKTAPHFGHHPLASAVYLAVYGLLLAMAVTGLGLAAVEHGMGPFAPWLTDSLWLKGLLKEPHEFGYWLLTAFVLAHFAALIRHEVADGTPLAQGMVSGYQYRIIHEGENHEK